MTAMAIEPPLLDFNAPSDEVAQRLIGVVVLIDGVGGRIVETEAYDRVDPASHTFSGQTPRNAVMFGPPGHAYVYRSYGIHWCLNFVCRESGHGAGVLIRAIEPLEGLARMRERRGVDDPRLLCSGPGRLGQAMGVTHALNGLSLDAPPFELRPATEPVEVLSGPRIGITKAMDLPWRFGLAGSKFVSRPFHAGRTVERVHMAPRLETPRRKPAR
jgi:DNA-3-methyladenine glycosylase